MAEQSLKSKTVKGVGWSAIDSLANQGITFLVGLVLARLLSPDEYGLIGIITIFISLFNVFINSGLNSALIRKQNTTDDDYNTMFIFNMAVSVLVFIILWFSAPWIAIFFRRSELTSLMRAMGSILFINAASIVQTTILTKQIDFKKQTKISLIASLSSGAIGIGMALAGLGVWSLVGQQISRQVLNAILLWVWSKWRPLFKFSTKSFTEMWSFGWKLLCSRLIDTAWNEIYQVVIGRWYSPISLGQYTRAQQFGSIFSTNITGVIQRVSYPVLSSIQDNPDRLKDAYKRVIKSTMLVTFTCMLGLAGIAKPLVLTLIGEQWRDCIPMLQIVCFNMMLYPLHSINLNMLQVQGRSDLFLKLEIIKKTIAIGPILLGVFVGIYWMLIGSVFTGFLCFFINGYYSGKYLKYSVWEQVKDIFPSFATAFIMAAIVFAMSFIRLSYPVLLLLQLIVGAGLTFILNEIIKTTEYNELKGIAFSIIKKGKK